MTYKYNETSETFYGESRRFDSPPTTLIVITVSVMATVLICSSVRAHFNFTIPRKLPVLLISILFGLLVPHIPHLNGLKYPHSGYPVRRFLAYYISAYCLRTIHMFKKPIFRRYFLIYTAMSFVPLLSSVMHGYAIYAAYEYEISITEGMLFGAIFCSVQPFFIMGLISGLDKFKLVHSLLQGEALIAPIWCFISLKIIRSFLIVPTEVQLARTVINVVKNQVGGLALGYIFAKSMTIPLSYLKFTANVTASIMLGTMVTAYCASDICDFQPYLTCLIIALIANHDKHMFSLDNEKSISGILEVLYTMADLATYAYCIMRLTVTLSKDFKYTSIHLYFFNYCASISTRFISYLLAYPLIKKMLPSFVFTDVMVLTTGNVVGNIPLILTMIILHLKDSHTIAELILPFMLTNALFTTILNNAGMSFLMSFIQSNSISAERIASVGQCLEVIAKEREKLINTMKMKRHMADVNWEFVRKVTSYKLPPPYPKAQVEKPVVSEVRTASVCCENCPLMPELYGGNRPKKLVHYKRTAMKRLVQEIKLIAKGHYEKRLISNECLTGIEKICDAIQTDQIHLTIDYDRLKQYSIHSRPLELLTNCYRKVFGIKMENVLVPRVRWRRPYHYILHNLYFRIFIAITIVFTVTETIADIGFNVQQTPLQSLLMDIVIMIIYTSEFFITIIAYSWVYWSEGFKSYFSSHWHIIDFISLVVTFTTVIKDVITFEMETSDYNEGTEVTIRILTVLHSMRALRVFRIISTTFPSIINSMQKNQNEMHIFGFELSKELVECINEILLVADRFVENKETRESLLESFREARKEIYKLLIEIKSKKSWVATTMETKQLINASKYVMSEALQYLKFSGFVDTTEYMEIIKSITENEMKVKNMMKIPALSTYTKLWNVWWMENDANLIDYLRKRVIIESLPAGEIICQQGYQIDGVYVISTGIVEVKYEPSNYTIDRLTQDGYLPIIDNIGNAKFEEPTHIYYMPGNSLGELGFLTGRHSDCDVTSLTDVKLWFIRREDLEYCMNMKQDTTEDLESRLWKYATTSLATAILISTTTHASYSIYDIRLKLERSLVPSLTFYSSFVVTEQIEDMILLEGVAVDFYTRDVYIAPCYIPRSVLKLEIPKQSFVNKQERIETKLMIIPASGTDKWAMMQTVEELANVPQQNRKYMRIVKKRRRNESTHASKISQASLGLNA